MGPRHGGHLGTNRRKLPDWHVFRKDEELEKYLKRAFDIRNTWGRLSARIEVRGYKDKANEKFNPEQIEYEGPFEAPGWTTDPANRDGPKRLARPNRLRTAFRNKIGWLAAQPSIWDTKPAWNSVIELSVTWRWTGDKLQAKYKYTEQGTSNEKGTSTEGMIAVDDKRK